MVSASKWRGGRNIPTPISGELLRPARETQAGAGAGRRAIAWHVFEPVEVEVLGSTGDADP